MPRTDKIPDISRGLPCVPPRDKKNVSQKSWKHGGSATSSESHDPNCRTQNHQQLFPKDHDTILKLTSRWSRAMSPAAALGPPLKAFPKISSDLSTSTSSARFLSSAPGGDEALAS